MRLLVYEQVGDFHLEKTQLSSQHVKEMPLRERTGPHKSGLRTLHQGNYHDVLCICVCSTTVSLESLCTLVLCTIIMSTLVSRIC